METLNLFKIELINKFKVSIVYPPIFPVNPY